MANSSNRSLAEVIGKVEARVPGLISNASQLAAVDVEVSAVTQDSREVTGGAVFAAIAGSSVDGHEFVDTALASGAAAVLVDESFDTTGKNQDAVFITSADTAKATGHIAAALLDYPTDDVRLVAVTGTNGKTSIVTIIEHLVNQSGGVGASMGTLTGSLTTAASPQFHQALADMRERGITVVAAEVSSHALDQKRIAGADVSVAVFTNLTQDHLDYHADMDEYFEAKALLFSNDVGAHSVIDVSDEYGQALARRVEETKGPEVQLREIEGNAIAAAGTLGQSSSTFQWRDQEIVLPLGGSFSVNNAVLAAEAAVLLGFDVDDVAGALESVPQIPGRFESVQQGQPFAVVVDYSHTPASVAAAIESARELADGRVIIVFGAGGDRDQGKRPLMAQAADAADVVYVTSDNPRTEDPAKIIDEVITGSSTPNKVHRIVDRAEAIGAAISGALPGDVVVIAGKGHENYQIVGTTRSEFDDRSHARAALALAGWENAS